ncbi:nicotinate (nicotinamide) nucleotide adenylyltransferase [Paenibacillus sp. An7]|uniref:nicotinate (nicotinamide) nucleotide adenylyltransferase n=1 Tax=Paenibacillus sp. An7 TaxID=2689577 RepID=UPI00135826F7|nr:nicotinate (nicotinamide) nucleotide adenylyltransferase [Paenibacillus sp. An7]
MGRVGIYGSSFDPITNVHLWTASTVAHRAKLDKVIFLPCSSNRPDKKMNSSDEHRMNMVNMAIQNNPKFEADRYEMEQPGWEISTYLTLKHYREKFPDDEIYFIMGADLLVDIGEGKWKRAEELIQENKFIVMARDGINMLSAISKSPILRNSDDGYTFHLIDKGLAMEISSSYIRDELKMGGEPRYLVPDACYDYIKTNHLYE